MSDGSGWVSIKGKTAGRNPERTPATEGTVVCKARLRAIETRGTDGQGGADNNSEVLIVVLADIAGETTELANCDAPADPGGQTNLERTKLDIDNGLKKELARGKEVR
jgi:hypothetical protein